jgi:hypothetical protein
MGSPTEPEQSGTSSRYGRPSDCCGGGAAIDKLHDGFRQPVIVVGMWRAALAGHYFVTEG